MNRLDAAITHLSSALKELGIRQPVTQAQIGLRIYMELLRQAIRHLTPGNQTRSVRLGLAFCTSAASEANCSYFEI
jgi:hypothetical protein